MVPLDIRGGSRLTVVVAVTALITLAGGCTRSGEKDAERDRPEVGRGVFLFGPTQGLSFVAGNESGRTNSQGAFTFEQGATIRFSLANVVIGQAVAKPIITPIDLVAGTQDETNPAAVNLARLLQTFDDDCDPSNGIKLVAVPAKELDHTKIDFSQGIAAFEDDESVRSLIAELTVPGERGCGVLAGTGDARSRLRDTLIQGLAGTYNGTFFGDAQGTWTIAIDAAGRVLGSGNWEGVGKFRIEGTVTSNGEVHFIEGGATTGASFSGLISSFGEISGGWVNNFLGETGTLSGARIALPEPPTTPRAIPPPPTTSSSPPLEPLPPLEPPPRGPLLKDPNPPGR